MTIGKIPVKFYLVQKRNYRIEEKKMWQECAIYDRF